MGTLKSVKHHRRFAHQLFGLVDITQGIAVMRMQQVRQSVLTTRIYMEGIIGVYKEIRHSHRKEVDKIIAKKGKKPQLKFAKKRQNISILLSPSGRFSGQLVRRVFKEFAEHIKATGHEVAIVGNTGREMMTQYLPEIKTPLFFELDLEHPSREQIAVLLFHVLEYENITVFTGKFESLVNQEPAAYNVTGYETLRVEPETTDQKPEAFLFEPKLDEIVSFFVAQVTATLLRETLDESKLANLGSRILTLESSRSSINQEIKKLDRVVRRMKRRVDSRKQSNRLSSMRFWR